MLDPRIPDGLSDIRQGWTLVDLLHAHDFLDELDAAEARAESQARAEAQTRSSARNLSRGRP